MYDLVSVNCTLLLIAPEGIEILMPIGQEKNVLTLLIAPEGIEIRLLRNWPLERLLF